MLWTIHYPGNAFTWTHPTPYDIKIDFYVQSNRNWKKRARCHNCGCAVASYNSRKDTWSIWGTQLLRESHVNSGTETTTTTSSRSSRVVGWDVVKPTAHIFYETRIFDVHDDLPKWDGYAGSSNLLG